MVRQECGETWVFQIPLLGRKGVDGRSKWSAGTRKTEVRLDGLCEDGLGQQRNDGGGGASMRKRSERLESPSTYCM